MIFYSFEAEALRLHIAEQASVTMSEIETSLVNQTSVLESMRRLASEVGNGAISVMAIGTIAVISVYGSLKGSSQNESRDAA